MKVLLFLLSVLCLSGQGATMFKYDPYFNLPQRPFPVELLLQVKAVKSLPVADKGVKSASVIQKTYTKELECTDQNNQEVAVQLTQKDFQDLKSPQAGNTLAAFGLERTKKIIFRLSKYEGEKDNSAMTKWFESLK
jgi:hypothetical protein